MIKLLIVEDNDVLRDTIGDYFNIIPGIDVVSYNGKLGVANGEDAILCLNQNKVDVMLLDLKMPKVDGYELLKIIKDFPFEFPRIIVFSGYSKESIRQEIIDSGVVDAFVQKGDSSVLEKLLKLIKNEK